MIGHSATPRQREAFAELIAPTSPGVFDADLRGRQMFHQRGLSDRFGKLLDWQALDVLIRDQCPRAPHFRVMRGGAAIPERRYFKVVETLRGPVNRLDPAGLMAELRNEGTLVWDAIDRHHRPIREVVAVVERSLGNFGFANAYGSWGTLGGVGEHWDDHDIFVLQLTGRKRWQVAPPLWPSPFPDDPDGEAPVAFPHDFTLEAGDLLYLPRGWWHRVTPLGEPSLHLTIGVLQPNNRDFLDWLLRSLRHEPLLRQDFPAAMSAVALQDHAAKLSEALAAAITPAALAAFDQDQRVRHPGDPWPSLGTVATASPADWPSGTGLVLLSSRAALIDDGDDIVFSAGAVEWRLPRGARPAFDMLMAGRTIALAELRKVISDIAIAGLVKDAILAVI